MFPMLAKRTPQREPQERCWPPPKLCSWAMVFHAPFPLFPLALSQRPFLLISVPLSAPVLTGTSRYGSIQPLNSSPSSVDIRTKESIHTQKRLEGK